MAQRLNFGNEVRELKLGSTFNSPKPRTSFHTLKYDFKPASIDLSKSATLDVSSNNQVTVTMPHLDTSGVPKAVFKGNQRNYTKECVLIIDKVTGEITLEKLHHNIQVKKTRTETKNRPITNFVPQQKEMMPQSISMPTTNSASSANNVAGAGSSNSACGLSGLSGTNGGPMHAIHNTNNSATTARQGYPENNTQRVSNKTRVSTGVRKSQPTLIQRHSPIQGSPSYPLHKSPQQAPAWNANNGQSTLPSIPIIGMDDDFMIGNSMPAFGNSHSTSMPTLPTLSASNDLPSLGGYQPSKPSTLSNKPSPLANNQIRHTNHNATNHVNMHGNSPYAKHNQSQLPPQLQLQPQQMHHQPHMDQP